MGPQAGQRVDVEIPETRHVAQAPPILSKPATRASAAVACLPWLTLRADWLVNAAGLPGKALHVGMAVWRAAAVNQCPHVPFTRDAWITFGVSRDCVYNALTRRSSACLVQEDRGRGRFPVVGLLDAQGQYLTPRVVPAVP